MDIIIIMIIMIMIRGLIGIEILGGAQNWRIWSSSWPLVRFFSMQLLPGMFVLMLFLYFWSDFFFLSFFSWVFFLLFSVLVIVFLVQSWDLLIGSDAYRTGLEVKSGLESLSLGHARVFYLVLGQLWCICTCLISLFLHFYEEIKVVFFLIFFAVPYLVGPWWWIWERKHCGICTIQGYAFASCYGVNHIGVFSVAVIDWSCREFKADPIDFLLLSPLPFI